MTSTSTVAILVCDLVASTARHARLGEDAADGFRASFFSVMRGAVERHHGEVVKNMGDGLLVVFRQSTVAALRCADELHGAVQALDGVDRTQLRIGVSAGEVAEEDGDWFGMPVIEASRLCTIAAPGCTATTGVVLNLVGSRGEYRFTRIGSKTLKGFPAPVEVWTVTEGAPSDDRPAASTVDRSKLIVDGPSPAIPVSSFVGRDEDAARAMALLDDFRIVTLCGPGGVGKSRLARHVAHAVAERYDDGVIWVELGSVQDPADVAGALATQLKLNALVDDALSARIVEVLAVRQHLVVLDTCEHVADAVAALVESIGAAADRVDVLLTSREPLRADGERVLTLAPLNEAGAVALLVDRIQSTEPRWVPDGEDADIVAEVAQRVDRLPLALELAAARVSVMGLRGLRDALDQPYEVLSRGRRNAVERHRSLKDVVDWSYRLLSPDQRDLFTRLAVFAGPVEWEAIVQVCRRGHDDHPEFHALADLVDRSLVTLQTGNPVTYGMLDTLRAFGRGQLSESDVQALNTRHSDWALALAEMTYAAEVTPDQGSARRRFDAHLADIRRAHASLSSAGPSDRLLRLTIVVAHHAYHRLSVDLVRLVDETLRLTSGMRHPLRVQLLGIAANFGWQRGELDTAEQRCEQAFALAQDLGDPSLGCAAHEAMGVVRMMRGDDEGARGESGRSLDLAVKSGDLYTQLLCLIDLGLTAAYTGDDETAAHYERLIGELASKVGAPTFIAWKSYLGGERQAERDPAAAVVQSARALELADAVDDRFLAALARLTMLTTAARTGDPVEISSFGPMIDHWHASGAWTQLWLALRSLIDTLARHGMHREVAMLLGAYSSSVRATPVFGADAARLDTATAAARAALGDEFDDIWAEGRAMTDDDALLMARQLTRASDR